MKRKRKRQAIGIESLRFGEWPFFGGVESADAADAGRYRLLTAGVFDLGFFADMVGATKAQWDEALDEKRN